MTLLTAEARARIWGTTNCWSLSPGPESRDPGQECIVSLEIEGDRQNGYHLVMSPAGFFTADYWYETREDALNEAEELFGVRPDEWTESSGC